MKQISFRKEIAPLALLTFLFSLAGTAGARAQPVQVGPGYVKAPFVRIYHGPEGTTVQAPFTRVQTNGSAQNRRNLPQLSVVPPSDPPGQHYDNVKQALPGSEISALERQRRKLAVLARRLDRDLMRLTTAARWQAFLQLPPEIVSAKRAVAMHPDVESLERILEHFALVAENKEYQSVANLGSFRILYRELQSYAMMLESLPTATAKPEDRSPVDAPTIKRLPSVLMSIEEPEFEQLPLGGLFQP